MCQSSITINEDQQLYCNYFGHILILIMEVHILISKKVTKISCVCLVPDDTVLQLLHERLSQLDAVTKGWVLHGFPKTREQGESLEKAGFEPNR